MRTPLDPGRRRAALVVFGTALVGLVGGHLATYLLVEPAHHARDALLHRTGHGYLPAAMAVGLALGLLAAFSAVEAGYRRARGVARRPTTTMPRWWSLAGLQAFSFVAIEVAERLISGAGSSHLGVILAVGLAVQVAAATMGVLLLRLLGRVGEAVARAVGRRSDHAAARTPWRGSAPGRSPRRPSLRGASSPRAPPLPASA